MEQPKEVTIPDLTIYQCGGCGRKTVAEVGRQLLCDNCVNEFLARNIGVMQPVKEQEDELE